MNGGHGRRGAPTRYTGSVGSDPEPKRRAGRLLVRVLGWSLPAAVAAAAFLFVARARADADLAQAAQLLIEARPAEARPLLDGHRDSGRVGGRARAGLALAGALDGGSTTIDFAPPDLAPYRPRTLMDSAYKIVSPLGLLSEDYDSTQRTMSGNFPQAYSHVGLIHAAFAAAPPWSGYA